MLFTHVLQIIHLSEELYLGGVPGWSGLARNRAFREKEVRRKGGAKAAWPIPLKCVSVNWDASSPPPTHPHTPSSVLDSESVFLHLALSFQKKQGANSSWVTQGRRNKSRPRSQAGDHEWLAYRHTTQEEILSKGRVLWVERYEKSEENTSK